MEDTRDLRLLGVSFRTAPVAVREALSFNRSQEVMRQRPQHPLLVIDTGLPRNVEPGAAIDLLAIDAIRERQEEGLAQRRVAIPAVERIVEEEVNAWAYWRASLPMERMLKRLYQRAVFLSQEATQQVVALDTPAPVQIERLIMQSFKQLLHRHARDLLGLPGRYEPGAHVAASSSLVQRAVNTPRVPDAGTCARRCLWRS
jgi:glutamyl-tRNA reductase